MVDRRRVVRSDTEVERSQPGQGEQHCKERHRHIREEAETPQEVDDSRPWQGGVGIQLGE